LKLLFGFNPRTENPSDPKEQRKRANDKELFRKASIPKQVVSKREAETDTDDGNIGIE
jgi:hypothetical protein